MEGFVSRKSENMTDRELANMIKELAKWAATAVQSWGAVEEDVLDAELCLEHLRVTWDVRRGRRSGEGL